MIISKLINQRVIKVSRIFIVTVFLQFIVGCNFDTSPNITKQELLYDYSKEERGFKVSLNTTLKFNTKIQDDKYFIVLEKDKIALVPIAKNSNEIKYKYYFKTKELVYGDSSFVSKIKNSPIVNLKNEKIEKSNSYKLDIKSTLWKGNDKQNPYLHYK